jgi:DNA polymerase (family 10)
MSCQLLKTFPVGNAEIAELFDELANLLDIEGANTFRVRAYRNAARTIRSYPTGIAVLL